MDKPLRFVLREALILIVLYLMFNVAFLFVYLAGFFLYVSLGTIRMLINRKVDHERQKSFAIQGVFFLTLLPVAIQSYRAYGNRDLLDRMRYYVFAGTGQSRALASAIAEEGDLDLNRLRTMITSDDDQDRSKAFEVLRARHKPGDVIALKEVILQIPESEYSPDTAVYSESSMWFIMWLHDAVGLDSKEELESWIPNEDSSSAQSTSGHTGS